MHPEVHPEAHSEAHPEVHPTPQYYILSKKGGLQGARLGYRVRDWVTGCETKQKGFRVTGCEIRAAVGARYEMQSEKRCSKT